MYLPPSPHPHHPHHLECPRCHSHNIVLQGDSRYVCLNCRWEQDLAQSATDPLTAFLVAVLTIAFVLLFFFPQSEPSEQDAQQGVGGHWKTSLALSAHSRF